MRSKAIALVLAVAALIAAAPASAHDVHHLIRKGGDLPEVRRLAELHRDLHQLLARYDALERHAGRAWLRTVGTIRQAEAAQMAADSARLRLDQRVRAVYQFGPGGSIEALLGATTFSDLAAIAEYTARTISIDDTAVRETVVAETALSAKLAQAEAERAAFAPRLERLRAMLAKMQRKVDEATLLAERAHLEAQALAAQALAAQERQIAAAMSRLGSWGLGVIDYQQDQSHLLAMLGPTGGQTCETPPDLVETGESFSGYASWYGWEFGGQPTATGAIFDPRLFTAANRWLPFGTFLRVRYGDRCAIVLINDRGPYGRLERVIDLSEAAAEYLGVGVSWVNADILVPRESLPGRPSVA
ncbi:MAG: RlpA-like double-psi beta-barrel domain-containing protein [Actinomycetota bacterium]